MSAHEISKTSNNDVLTSGSMISPNRSVSNDKERSLVLAKDTCETVTVSKEGFLARLSAVMNDQTVKSFFRDYFSSWSDARAALMLMHTYTVVEDFLRASSGGKPVASEEITAGVKEMMANAACRRLLVEAMTDYSTEHDRKFVDAFQMALTPSILPSSSPVAPTFGESSASLSLYTSIRDRSPLVAAPLVAPLGTAVPHTLESRRALQQPIDRKEQFDRKEQVELKEQFDRKEQVNQQQIGIENGK